MMWWTGLSGVSGLLFATNVTEAWLVPALMLVLVVVASWLGLRWIQGEHLEALRSVPLFSGLSRGELMSILRSARPVAFEPGQRIIEEGESGKGFFAMTDGSATVRVAGTDVVTLGSGSYFGEMAVIDGGPRTATITAETRVSALELTPSAFLRVLDAEPSLARSISEELCRRLGDAADPAVCDDDRPVDRDTLVELSRSLRKIEHPDWTQATTGRRWPRLGRLFARGS